ncbi:VWA domain-containing protein [Shewanella sp. D64]|uniref:vWA domain-containing protein n=1 Tax=unclassified Shewanella TaxID=196818 RepID=UPI0022BA29A9|nr:MULTISPECIES: VWA domain-containing protein [unclassified Shewanella]MEC4727016.1 VWA domain-containing protein [Shewanella sp. D64]MEC4737755.1 VWA domain-containing protein [Shewanella sp. E94]WBJ93983.1 VWA domain-containing protein [Shewanella sp. MTB7]
MLIQIKKGMQERNIRLSSNSLALVMSSSLALVACSGQQPLESETAKGVNEDKPTQVLTLKPESTNAQVLRILSRVTQADPSFRLENSHINAPSQDKASVSDSYIAGQQASDRMMKMKALSRSDRLVQMSYPLREHYDLGIGQQDRNRFERQVANGIMVAGEISVSTFSIDVDTGSYSTLRRWINQGRLPEKGTIRIEEMVNYFAYQYPSPNAGEQPFSVNTELAPSPYNTDKMLLRIGLKGFEKDKASLGASHLVFLLDVSGSMSSRDKLPLLKSSLKMLSQQLDEQDRISVVVYAGASGVVLDGVKGNDHLAISQALDKLKAGGSTNGEAGIVQAYQLAQKHFIHGGVNRVILATDGDFNLGMSDQQGLIELIEEKRKHGIALTTLGFGQGNYNDHLMEQLADKGNGHYAYIDTLNEARKVLVDELSATLMTIAKDVKVQVEFNPAIVSEYRLIGYENRILNREDFNNDKVDAGEIGAGHRVTALYELSFVDSPNQANDKLRYGVDTTTGKEKYSRTELAYLKLRYKPIGEEVSKLISYPILKDTALRNFAQASDDFRFAVAVAGLGQLINKNHYIGHLNYAKVSEIAQSAMGEDPFGYRHEFVQLTKTAGLLAKP